MKKFVAKNENGMPVDGSDSDVNAMADNTEPKKKKGRQAGSVPPNQNMAIVVLKDGTVNVNSFVRKTELTKWCSENLQNGLESLSDTCLLDKEGNYVLLVFGHVLKATKKTITKVVL